MPAHPTAPHEDKVCCINAVSNVIDGYKCSMEKTVAAPEEHPVMTTTRVPI